MDSQLALPPPPGALLDRLLDDLAGPGWSVQQGFVPDAVVDGLIAEAEALWGAGIFERAGIGQGDRRVIRPEIRSDRILWLEPEALPAAVVPYWAAIDALRQTLNRALYLGLRDFEAHLAVYPRGSFYRRHLDQHAATQHRWITCLLYLNRHWDPADGGQLRIYPDSRDDAFVEVWPEAGTFVCFRSDTILHEVRPTERERLSLTGWLRKERML